VAALPLPDLAPRIVGMAWHRDRDSCPKVAALQDAARHALGAG
jgi:hypothetical protein